MNFHLEFGNFLVNNYQTYIHQLYKFVNYCSSFAKRRESLTLLNDIRGIDVDGSIASKNVGGIPVVSNVLLTKMRGFML